LTTYRTNKKTKGKYFHNFDKAEINQWIFINTWFNRY